MRWLTGLSLSVLILPGLALLLQAQEKASSSDRVLNLFADEFVPLTPGTGKFPASFQMGSTGQGALPSEQPAVTVTFRYPFAMAKYEVTQELYGTVMGGNPSRWRGPRNSVEKIDWNEANDFCKKATLQLRKMKRLKESEEIRLPSEAEWEYACRAGTTTPYSFGDGIDNLKAHAWFNGNSKGEDPPVGRKKPNPWGLYDMHGYIWEWCADAWHPDLKGVPSDGSPRIKVGEKERVVRGGSWADSADSARSAYRGHQPLTTRNDRIGFRCVQASVKAK